MELRFGDHSSFHRAAAGMVGGAALLGLALHPVTPMAPLVGGLFGIAVGAAWGYGKSAWRLAAATVATVPLLVMTPHAPALSIVAVTLAMGLSIGGLRGTRGALALMFGAVTTLLAMWTAQRFANAQQLTPGFTTDAAAAAAMGMVGVFAVLPRHLKLVIDPVRAAVRQLPSDLDLEVRGLCERAVAIWSGAKEKLADQESGKNLVRDGVLKTIEVAMKSADVRVDGATDQQLTKRMDDLDQRIAAATDAEVRTQYQSARAALDDQRRYRDHIRQNRERLIARMHNHVAALEKFQLAATGLQAVRAASDGATAVKQLEELSHDVAASGDALAEMELGVAPEVISEPAVTATVTADASV